MTQFSIQWILSLNHLSQNRGQVHKRIETLLELDAFQEIHRAWKRLGYPFDSLVPSYATAIGVSGDTPAALAKLVGIVLNDGVLYPTVSIQELHFGGGTPAETILTRRLPPGERLLHPVISRLVRREMLGVVENGTGRRVHGGLKLPDGTLIPIGGKTGTGDNEIRIYGAKGSLLGSRAVNRTAAFAFFIGDRFFGTIVAFVPGREAANYKFTSALAVQVLKDLTPSFLPLIESAEPNDFKVIHGKVRPVVVSDATPRLTSRHIECYPYDERPPSSRSYNFFSSAALGVFRTISSAS